MQRHPFPKGNDMEASWQKALSNNANKAITCCHRVAASVLRAAHDLRLRSAVHATWIKQQATLRPMLRRLAAYRNLALFGLSSLSTAVAFQEITGRAPREVARLAEPLRLTVEDHWRRATGVILAALASFQRVKSLNAAAVRQLDSADYALTQLLHDLRPVMGLPADVSGLRAVLAEAERSSRSRDVRKALAA
jgi:hypothetical protein